MRLDNQFLGLSIQILQYSLQISVINYIYVIKVINDLRVELYLCLRIVKYLRTITMLLIKSSVEIKQ